MQDSRNTTLSLSQYAFITGCYWVLMLSDGALRMLCVLHFYQRGFSALELSLIFLLYECAGIATNLLGGWIASRTGLKLTLWTGLALQVVSLLTLACLPPHWGVGVTLLSVTLIQMLAGVAKDLTKMSSKSAVKLLQTGRQNPHRLFHLVALLTGSKNAMKGLGFFAGASLLWHFGFSHALFLLACPLILALFLSLFTHNITLGKTKKKVRFSELFSKSAAINRLSLARAALFGSRDVWFVVCLPLFLGESLGWSFDSIGAFMAFWIIGYGIIQAVTPRLTGKNRTLGQALHSLHFYGAILSLLCFLLAFCIIFHWHSPIVLPIGLCLFGIIFAINSSIHSYLILAYTTHNQVTLDVGFYYMANACGRLLGTLLSGACYLLWGLPAGLLAAGALSGIAFLLSQKLPQE